MSGFTHDQGLIDACRAGKTEAYGILVRRYQDRLYPTVLRLTGCAEDAQDLLQETFLRAYQKLGRFHGESSFYTWIYRIAVNLALSRRRRKRPMLLLGDGPAGGELTMDSRETRTRRLPMERAERGSEIIQGALNALAADHRGGGRDERVRRSSLRRNRGRSWAFRWGPSGAACIAPAANFEIVSAF